MKEIKQKKPLIRGFIRCVTAVILVLALPVAGLNLIVCLDSRSRMFSVEDSVNKNGYDCIIVLGCGVWGDRPTPLLSDRLDAALALYENGAAPKLLMSGDHGQKDYDEVSVMRQYALDRGVPSEDIFMDHAGFSTYDYAPCGVFEDFYIRPAFRHKGVARELVRFARADSGVGSLTVGCADCDMVMYEALGFSVRLGNLLAYE